jgi:hypothetical protein
MACLRWVALCCLFVGAPAQTATLTDAPFRPAAAEAELPDQLGGSGSVAAHRGEVTVAMVVTAARLRNLKAWQRDLQERLEGVTFVLIADVPSDPPVTLERVVSKLGEKVPEEVPVLIDLERLWATELELDTGRPNVLLFDRDGFLVESFRGFAREDIVESAARRLEELLDR